jgi:hypothetical protein
MGRIHYPTYEMENNTCLKPPYIVLVGGKTTPMKNMSSSVGMMTFPIYGKIKHVPNHQPEWYINSIEIYSVLYNSCQWLPTGAGFRHPQKVVCACCVLCWGGPCFCCVDM